MTRSRICVAVVLVVIGLVGPLGLPELSASTPPGYVRVKVKKAGISIAVPDDWEAVSATRKEARRILKLNPDMKAAGVTVDSLLSSPLKAGWDRDGDGYPDRYLEVAIAGPVLGFPSPDEFRSQFEIPQLGLQNVTVEASRVAGRRALFSEFDAVATRTDGVTARVHQSALWFMVESPVLLSVTFSRTAEIDPEFDEQMQVMVDSIKILKTKK